LDDRAVILSDIAAITRRLSHRSPGNVNTQIAPPSGTSGNSPAQLLERVKLRDQTFSPVPT